MLKDYSGNQSSKHFGSRTLFRNAALQDRVDFTQQTTKEADFSGESCFCVGVSELLLEGYANSLSRPLFCSYSHVEITRFARVSF